MESLKSMRPNIYKFGKLIQDVTTHPATKGRWKATPGFRRLPRSEVSLMTYRNLLSFTRRENSQLDRDDRDLGRHHGQFQIKRWMFRFTGSCKAVCALAGTLKMYMWNVTAYD